jgi:hypothetical protein
MGKADELLAEAPSIEQIDVLADKLPASCPRTPVTPSETTDDPRSTTANSAPVPGIFGVKLARQRSIVPFPSGTMSTSAR